MKELRQFLSSYRVKAFTKGELILCEGEVPQAAYFVKKGIVKIYNLTNDGLEKPISFDLEYEMFPTGWVFGMVKRAQFFYEAFSACELFVVSREDYLEYLRTDNQVLYQQFHDIVTKYLNFEVRVYALEQSKASQKLIHTLHFFILRFGKHIRGSMVRITLPLTQQDLANFIGLTRETTGLELKKLEQKGILSHRRRHYMVDVNKLHQLLDDNYDLSRLLQSKKLKV